MSTNVKKDSLNKVSARYLLTRLRAGVKLLYNAGFACFAPFEFLRSLSDAIIALDACISMIDDEDFLVMSTNVTKDSWKKSSTRHILTRLHDGVRLVYDTVYSSSSASVDFRLCLSDALLALGCCLYMIDSDIDYEA